MTPVLIDMHVRPVLNEAGQHDTELLAVQARDHGLDGLAVVGVDEPVSLGATAALSEATGVAFFCGVELATDAGRFVCFPKVLDAWYDGAGWKGLPRASGSADLYAAEAVVRAFAERGGAVVGVSSAFEQDAPARPAGVSALDVTFVQAPGEAEVAAADALDELALRSAYAGRLSCVAGSRAVPGESRFGTVATLFAAPPTTQEALVEGLRSGRVWPVEIGTPGAWAALQPKRSHSDRQPANGQQQAHGRHHAESDAAHDGAEHPGGGHASHSASGTGSAGHANGHAGANGHAASTNGHAGGTSGHAGTERRERAPSAAQRKNGRYHDPHERPGDARGNRLNRDALRRQLVSPADDEAQPTFDPVAAMYGLDGRKALRLSGKSDVELDRINGNRSKGSDTNIMVLPSFDELRQERQHINLLFAQTEEAVDREDSVSLYWALSYFRDEDGQPTRDLSQLPAGQAGRGVGGRRRRRR